MRERGGGELEEAAAVVEGGGDPTSPALSPIRVHGPIAVRGAETHQPITGTPLHPPRGVKTQNFFLTYLKGRPLHGREIATPHG